MKLTKELKIKIIYTSLIVILIANIWKLMYKAQFMEYDDNWGNLIVAFVIALCTNIIIALLWFKMRYIIKLCKWQTVLFFILASPITVAVVVLNYHFFFGAIIKN